MADIELVIKVSEELYNRFGHEYSDENLISKYTNDAILDAFCNGTPLPKGHGDLIDRKDLIADFKASKKISFAKRMDISCIVDHTPTIIEADKAESEEKI